MKKAFALLLAIILALPSKFVVGTETAKEMNTTTSEFLVKYNPDALLNSEDTSNMGAQLFTDEVQTNLQINDYVEHTLEQNIAAVTAIEIKDELPEDSSGSVIQLVSVESSDQEMVLEQLREMEGIEYAEPNYRIKATYDSGFSQQWGLNPDANYDINIQEAWNITQGSKEVIVAVIDTGIDTSHIDLTNNIYTSNDTVNYDDSDKNGYKDDVHGWDFTTYVNTTQNGDNSVYDDPIVDQHGTAVAGVIAAAQNIFGIQGVAPNVIILPLKVLGANGGSVFHAIKAIEYAMSKGAKIANCSWETEFYSQFLYDAINQSDMLFVCASGNDNKNFAESKSYPAAYELDNIISVGALTEDGGKANFSNYGEGVDLFAPGENIYSTFPQNSYGNSDGTSFAAPFVTGTAALIQSISPNSLPADIKERILSSVTKKEGLQGYVETDGYLNAGSAVLTTIEPTNLPSGQYGTGYIVHNNEIYAIGGFDGNNHKSSIMKYIPALGKWNEVASLPYGVSEMALAAHGDNIYILGGTNDESTISSLKSVFIYDTSNNTLVAGAEMPEGLSATSYATLDDITYIFGGLNENGYSNKVYAYNLVNNTWESKQDLPFEFAYGQAVVSGNEIYLIGGSNAEGCRREIHEYKLEGEKTVFKTVMNVPRKDFAASVIDNKIYIMGGTVSFHEYGTNNLLQSNPQNAFFDILTDVIECYTIYENNCEKVDSLANPAAGLRSVESFSSIYLMGGWNGEYLPTVQKYFGIAYPKNIRITSSGASLTLKWSPVNGATGYELEINGKLYTTTYTGVSISANENEEQVIRIRSVKDGQYSLWSDYHYHYFNSTLLDAKKVASSFTVSDKLYEVDQTKWYRISVDQAGVMDITLSNVPEDCTYIVQLRDSSGAVLASGDSEISDYVLTKWNYYITVTAVIGCSGSQAYTLTGKFTASANSNTLPDRIKAAFAQPASMSDDMDITDMNMRSIDEYEGEEKPDTIDEAEKSEPLRSAGGGSTMGSVPVQAAISTDAVVAAESIMPASVMDSTVETGSLSGQGTSVTKQISLKAGIPLSNTDRLKIVVRVVPDNPNDVFALEWTGTDTTTNNFWYHWIGEPRQYYLTATLSFFENDRKFQYNIIYETKSAGSLGKYTIYTDYIIDKIGNEDFKSETGNDNPQIADKISGSNNLSVTGKIDHPRDIDFYTINVQGNQKLTAVLESPEGKMYYVNILDHAGNSTDWTASQHMDGWYQESIGLSWATINTGNVSRNYIIRVNGDGEKFSADETYTLKIFMHNINANIGDLEINDYFAQADSSMSSVQNNYIGSTNKTATPLNFVIDSPVDKDRFAVTMNAGEKLSVLMSMPSSYNDAKYAYRIVICSDVKEGNGQWTWKELQFNNPDSYYSKYVTFIAEKAGTYYVSIESRTQQYNDSLSGAVTITKTPKSSFDKQEIKGPEGYQCSSDFISVVVMAILDIPLYGVNGYTDFTNAISGNFDNQLDVDWYRYTNGASAKNVLMHISENDDSIADNCGIIVLDENFNLLSEGTPGYVYGLAPHGVYYIGAYVKDNMYGNIMSNRNYTVAVQEVPKFSASVSNLSYNEGKGAMLGDANRASFDLIYSGHTNLPYTVELLMTWGDNPQFYSKGKVKLKLTGGVANFSFTNITIAGTNEEKLKTKIRVYLAGAPVYESEAFEQSVTQVMPAKLKFHKDPNKNFIYVNNPEYITQLDLTDGTSKDKSKIFEQQNVTGYNTFYETHITRHGAESSIAPFPHDPFYLDIDFYNSGDTEVTILVSHLAYGTESQDLLDYFDKNNNIKILLKPGEHKLLFDAWYEQGGEFLLIPSGGYAAMYILFDFTVTNGNVSLSSLASYERKNLQLEQYYENILNSNIELTAGEIVFLDRPHEPDIYQKYKGIARNQSMQIDAELEYYINDDITSQTLPVRMQDDYYPGGVWYPSTWWMTQMNPLHDEWDGLLYAMPGNLHEFTYHYEDTDRLWHFDFYHRKADYFTPEGDSTVSVNDSVPIEIIENAKSDVAAGRKNHFNKAPDADSLGMGSWGVTYHYTITIHNTGGLDRSVSFWIENSDNVIVGYREGSDQTYHTRFAGSIPDTKDGEPKNADGKVEEFVVKPASSITFEVITLSGIGRGGLNNWLELK